jgi:hypothetical protein
MWLGSIRWQQAAPGSGPWFVGDPASQKVLQVGQREFRTTWTIQIQGSFSGAACLPGSLSAARYR